MLSKGSECMDDEDEDSCGCCSINDGTGSPTAAASGVCGASLEDNKENGGEITDWGSALSVKLEPAEPGVKAMPLLRGRAGEGRDLEEECRPLRADCNDCWWCSVYVRAQS